MDFQIKVLMPIALFLIKIRFYISNCNPFLGRPIPTRFWFWLFICSTCATHYSLAQTDSTVTTESYARQKPLFSIGLGIQHGFIFPHSVDVQNTSGARPTGLEGVLSWQRNDSASVALCHCYPRQGLLLAYYDYDVGLLGKSGTAAYFLEPTYRISDRLLFSIKGAAGLTYLNMPYDSISNPGNQSYSTRLSFHLLLGLGIWLQLSEQWWLNPSINYQHISNGGMRQPNKGINWPTAGITLSYQPNSRPWHSEIKNNGKFWENYSARYDFTLIGTMQVGQNHSGNPKRFLMGGLAFQAGKQVGRLSMLTLGAEIYRDEKLKDNIRKDELNVSPVKAGLMLGHEFLLGRFQFSQRLGVYIFDQTPYYDRLFHRWGIKYRINRHISTGINMLAHRQVADFVDFRLTYTFQKKYK
ncbi:MAG: acyloxyacyl hydrolase [Bacteroidota bacterium]